MADTASPLLLNKRTRPLLQFRVGLGVARVVWLMLAVRMGARTITLMDFRDNAASRRVATRMDRTSGGSWRAATVMGATGVLVDDFSIPPALFLANLHQTSKSILPQTSTSSHPISPQPTSSIAWKVSLS